MGRTVANIHSVFLKQHFLTAALCCVALLTPLGARCQTGPLPTEATTETLHLSTPESLGYRPTKDLRPLATFGITVGIQTFGVLTATLLAGVGSAFTDQSILVGWGAVAAIAPAISGVVTWQVGKTSRLYSSPVGAILGGAYVGAALGYLAIYFTVRKDNPTVDGRYDPIYFGRNDATNAFLNVVAYGLAPVLLPAIGAAVGHLVMRRPLKKPSGIALSPPSVSIFPNPLKPRSLDIGIQFVRATF